MELLYTPFFDSNEVFKLDRSLIDAFCERYGVELQQVSIDEETFPPTGLMYFLSDDLGGYNRVGLNASLGIPTIGRGD